MREEDAFVEPPLRVGPSVLIAGSIRTTSEARRSGQSLCPLSVPLSFFVCLQMPFTTDVSSSLLLSPTREIVSVLQLSRSHLDDPNDPLSLNGVDA
jgi:hypothetical protein